MKKILFTLASALTFFSAFTQNVGINSTGAAPNSSAGLDVDFTNMGILIPRVSLTQTSLASPITSPATSLVVYNTATANDVTPGFYYWDGTQWVRLLNGSGAGAAWLTNGNSISGSEFIGTTNATDWIVKTNNSEIYRVTSGGLIGVGTFTTTPLGKLDIRGGGTDTKLTIYSENAANLTTFDFGATPGNPDGSLSSAASAGQFSEFSTQNDIVLRARIGDLILTTRNISSPATGDILFGTGFPNTEKMRIANNGNVGIGTTTPDAEFEVVSLSTTTPRGILNSAYNNSGSTEAQLRFRRARGTEGSPTVLVSGDEIGGVLFDGYTGSAFGVSARILGITTENWSGTALGTCITFETTTNGTTSPSERVRIDHSGKIGIGITNPAYKMDISLADGDGIRTSSTIHATFDANAYENVFRILSTNNTNGVNKPNNTIFLQGLSAGSTYGAFQIVANASNSDPLIYWRTEINNSGVWNPWLQMAAYNTSGNLGVNTTSPTAQLDVNGSTGYNQLRMRTSFTPANSADANGNTGDVAWDDNYVYVKTNAGWRRTALTAF